MSDINVLFLKSNLYHLSRVWLRLKNIFILGRDFLFFFLYKKELNANNRIGGESTISESSLAGWN